MEVLEKNKNKLKLSPFDSGLSRDKAELKRDKKEAEWSSPAPTNKEAKQDKDKGAHLAHRWARDPG